MIVVRVTPASANASPISAPRSSSSTTARSGALVRRMNCHHVCPARADRDSRTAVRNENVSSTIATPSTPNAQPGLSSSVGARTLCEPSYSANSPPTRKIVSATRNA